MRGRATNTTTTRRDRAVSITDRNGFNIAYLCSTAGVDICRLGASARSFKFNSE